MKYAARGSIFFLLLLLPACGFHAVYGEHGTDSPTAEELQQTAIDNIPDRPGQMLRNALIDRMYGKHRPSQPKYRLTVHLRTAQSDVGLLSNAVATLSEVDSFGDFTLTNTAGKVLLTGTSHSESSFNRINDEFATQAGHDGAVARTVDEVSEQIVNRLSLYFAERSEHPIPDKSKTDQPAAKTP